MTRPLRVLIVDDSEHDASLMVLALRREGLAVGSRTVDTPEALAEAFKGPPWDVVLADHSMPRFDSFAVLEASRAAGSLAPVVIVSGQIGEENLVKVMHSGAADYVSKDHLARLPAAVARAVAAAEATRERARLEEERRLFFELSEDLFAITDIKGRFRQMNAAWTRVLGRTEEDLHAMGVRGLVLQEDRPLARTVMDDVASGKNLRGYENRLVTKDGDVRTFLWNATPNLATGTVYVVARDITQRKREESIMRRQDRMASLGTLVAGVAHEINNPLMYMLGNLDLAGGMLGEEESAADVPTRTRASLAKARECLQSVTRGAHRIEKVALALSAVARPSSSRHGPLDLNGLVEAVLETVRPEFPPGTLVETSLRAHALPVTESGEMSQILITILTNAAEAASASDPPRIGVRTLDEGDRVRIDISDNGPGISPEDAPKVFRPFFTTKPRGIGLGLSVCHTLVEGHGGTLDFTTIPGRGTTFHILVPAEQNGPARAS